MYKVMDLFSEVKSGTGRLKPPPTSVFNTALLDLLSSLMVMIESRFKVIWACEAKAHRSIHQIEDAPIVRDLEIYIQSLVSDSSLCECSCVKYLILRILSPIMI